MKAIHRALLIVLAAAVMAAGWPSIAPDHTSLLKQSDLAGTILSQRALADATDTTTAFSRSAKNAIVSMQAVAGIRTVIEPDDAKACSSLTQGIDIPLYKYTTKNVHPAFCAWSTTDVPTIIVSYIEAPPTPPPRIV